VLFALLLRSDNIVALFSRSSLPSAFASFQRNYLLVYALVVGADWLQGIFVSAIYQCYGYDETFRSRFFIAGFLSSGLLGTFFGPLADKFGRKRASLLYAPAPASRRRRL
jgi:hypothetical protein